MLLCTHSNHHSMPLHHPCTYSRSIGSVKSDVVDGEEQLVESLGDVGRREDVAVEVGDQLGDELPLVVVPVESKKDGHLENLRHARRSDVEVIQTLLRNSMIICNYFLCITSCNYF